LTSRFAVCDNQSAEKSLYLPHRVVPAWGLKGKPVKIRRGTATVTGDETRINATGA